MRDRVSWQEDRRLTNTAANHADLRPYELDPGTYYLSIVRDRSVRDQLLPGPAGALAVFQHRSERRQRRNLFSPASKLSPKISSRSAWTTRSAPTTACSERICMTIPTTSSRTGFSRSIPNHTHGGKPLRLRKTTRSVPASSIPPALVITETMSATYLRHRKSSRRPADTALGAIPGQHAPRLTVRGGITDFFGGVNSGSHYLHTWNSYQYYDDAFWTHGAHTIKFGGGAERIQYNEHTFQEPGGRYQFSNYTNFLQGIPRSFEGSLVNLVDNPREFRQTIIGLYVQDDWKMKSNLTINIGVRYQPSTVLKDAQGRITNLASITDQSPVCGVQFSAPIPAQPGSACSSVGPYYSNATLRNFEPRLGFAWDPFKDGKSSVRGGFGIYDVDPIPGYFLLQQNQAAPFLIFKSTKDFSPASIQPGFLSPFAAQEGGAQLVNSTSSNLAMSTVEANPHRSYVEEWNLTLQRQLTSDMTLTVGYVGTRGVHLMTRGDDGNMAGAPGSAAVYAKTQFGYLFPCGLSRFRCGYLLYTWDIRRHRSPRRREHRATQSQPGNYSLYLLECKRQLQRPERQPGKEVCSWLPVPGRLYVCEVAG